MKHKTWFRLALKAMGVFFAIQGAVYTLANLPGFLMAVWNSFVSGISWGGVVDSFWQMSGLLYGVPMLAAGLYLFFRGEWIVNKAIPSNRPYCPHCGYDLSRGGGTVCPECGVALPEGLVGPKSPPTEPPAG
jgi:hypothetical protein